MGYEHRNRCGDVYLLQASKSAKGKPRFYFGRKRTGEPVDEVPAGYEVFESPERGQVYLRKERASRITPLEREIVAEGIRRFSSLRHFLVDAEEDALVVYLPTRSVEQMNQLVCELAGPGALQSPRLLAARDRSMRSSPHEKIMRFQLRDEERRQFHASRWCFLQRHDSWIHLAGPAPLKALVEHYAEHLGEESFFELF